MQNRYEASLEPAISLSGTYWISIKDVDNFNCKFFWQNSTTYEGEMLWWDETQQIYRVLPYNISCCLIGDETFPCLSVDTNEGSVHFGELPFEIHVNMNAGIWPPATFGAEVTFLICYFCGIQPRPLNCADYETSWWDNPPTDMPAGWPNCDNPALIKK